LSDAAVLATWVETALRKPCYLGQLLIWGPMRTRFGSRVRSTGGKASFPEKIEASGMSSEQQRQLNQAALAYLNLWARTDLRLISGLSGERNQHARISTLHDLAKKYRVARGFSTEKQRDKAGRLDETAVRAFWGKVLRHVEETAGSGTRDNRLVVEQLAKKLGEHGRSSEGKAKCLTSAATKFLWFARRRSVRIYDKRAVDALRQLEGWPKHKAVEYQRFELAWDKQWKVHSSELTTAVAALPHLFDWSAVLADQTDEARRVMRAEWFKHRVFDQYLWALGSQSDQDLADDTGNLR
jgi:hypothetical protein